MKYKILNLLILFFCFNSIIAQETLPNFNAFFLGGNKAQITWINNFSNCTQISIQKSYDSTKFFQTIFTTQSPELPANGFVDNNYLPQIKTWYRIFYVTDTVGSFFFTKSKTPIIEVKEPKKNFPITISNEEKTDIKAAVDNKINTTIEPPIQIPLEIKIKIFFKKPDSLISILNTTDFLNFKDSLNRFTKDTLTNFKHYEYMLKPYVPIVIWKPSLFVYSNKNGVIELYNPAYKTKQYKIIVFDKNGKECFRIKQLKTEKLFLEKSNFLQSGWYNFELYEEDKLKERNKFLVEKDKIN